MTRKPDPLHNLADALSEDIVATPADALVHEADDGLVTTFDRVASRAAAQSRRRRLVERLRAILPAWPAPIGWTSAMAGVAGICVMGIAGGLYFRQPDVRLASSPPVVSGLIAGRDAPASLAQDRQVVAARAARIDHAAAEQPAPAAAPPAVAAAPPPAPPAAAGVADEPQRLRTADVRPDAAAPAPSTRAARKVAPSQQQAEDRIAALAREAERNSRFNTALVSPQPAPAAPAASAYAPTTSGPAVVGGMVDAPSGFAWPLRGRVIAGFGSPVGGAPNQGIDLAVPAGTDIRAAQDGVVIYAGTEIRSLGNLLLVRHRDGFLTAYAHAQSFAVKPGETVRRGQVIAKSGQSGEVSAPQLHFEIRRRSAPVDPAHYLPPPG
jgi:murein DD-endopeptidase MepM/ murein hydrolase activator NlpD